MLKFNKRHAIIRKTVADFSIFIIASTKLAICEVVFKSFKSWLHSKVFRKDKIPKIRKADKMDVFVFLNKVDKKKI